MRLRVDFGPNIRKEVNWYSALDDFPKFMTYAGKRYEWFMYDRDPNKQVDYVLSFSELPSFDPNYYVEMEDFDLMFGGSMGIKCECGAIYTSFPQIHMFMCKLWRKP
jgi:hypothetical protein